MGFTPGQDYWHWPRGHNYRLSNAHASCILDNLPHLDGWLQCRREQCAAYDKVVPEAYRLSSRETPWVYDLRVPGLTTDGQRKLVNYLRDHGLGARYGFRPCSLQPEFTGRVDPDQSELDVSLDVATSHAARWGREVVYVPLGQTLGMDVQRAASVLAAGLGVVLGTAA